MGVYEATQAVVQAVMDWEQAPPGPRAGKAWKAFEGALATLIRVAGAQREERPLSHEAVAAMEAG